MSYYSDLGDSYGDYPYYQDYVTDEDTAIVTYSAGGGDDNTRRRTRTTTLTPEPTPAAPTSSIVETPLIEEPIPAAPLPKTGGVAPYLVYGLGMLLAGGGLAFRKKENKDK